MRHDVGECRSAADTGRPYSTCVFPSDSAKALSDARETDPQFDANVQDNNCTQRREDEAGGVKAFVCGRHEQMSYGSAKDRADNPKNDGPEPSAAPLTVISGS